MLTQQNKIGLVLALLLGLSDIAILGALAGDDSSQKPPMAIVITSVVLGVATVVLVAMAWRNPTWPLMVAVIVLRGLSALGDLAGLPEGGGVLVISLVLLVFSLVCLWLLRTWVRRPVDQHPAAAVG